MLDDAGRPLDCDEVAFDAEQPLDDADRLLVPSFTEVVVADGAVRVDDVERRPKVIVERAPHRVVVVERDGVLDPAGLRRSPDELDVVLERELRGVDADHDQSVVRVGLRPGTDVRLLAQPVDASQRPEVHEDDVAPQLGGAVPLGAEPPGRPAEHGRARSREHGQLTERPELDASRHLGSCA
jgi:hypothetical protein